MNNIFFSFRVLSKEISKASVLFKVVSVQETRILHPRLERKTRVPAAGCCRHESRADVESGVNVPELQMELLPAAGLSVSEGLYDTLAIRAVLQQSKGGPEFLAKLSSSDISLETLLSELDSEFPTLFSGKSQADAQQSITRAVSRLAKGPETVSYYGAKELVRGFFKWIRHCCSRKEKNSDSGAPESRHFEGSSEIRMLRRERRAFYDVGSTWFRWMFFVIDKAIVTAKALFGRASYQAAIGVSGLFGSFAIPLLMAGYAGANQNERPDVRTPEELNRLIEDLFRNQVFLGSMSVEETIAALIHMAPVATSEIKGLVEAIQARSVDDLETQMKELAFSGMDQRLLRLMCTPSDKRQLSQEQIQSIFSRLDNTSGKWNTTCRIASRFGRALTFGFCCKPKVNCALPAEDIQFLSDVIGNQEGVTAEQFSQFWTILDKDTVNPDMRQELLESAWAVNSQLRAHMIRKFSQPISASLERVNGIAGEMGSVPLSTVAAGFRAARAELAGDQVSEWPMALRLAMIDHPELLSVFPQTVGFTLEQQSDLFCGMVNRLEQTGYVAWNNSSEAACLVLRAWLQELSVMPVKTPEQKALFHQMSLLTLWGLMATETNPTGKGSRYMMFLSRAATGLADGKSAKLLGLCVQPILDLINFISFWSTEKFLGLFGVTFTGVV